MERSDKVIAWATEAVGPYRRLGFFNRYRHLSDRELVDALMALPGPDDFNPLARSDLEEDLDEDDLDFHFLVLDEERVGWISPLCTDPYLERPNHENHWYAKTLHIMTAVGRGLVVFDDALERWETPQGPISVSFVYQNRRYALAARPVDDDAEDWFPYDEFFIHEVNRIVQPTGYRYYLSYPEAQEIWGGLLVLLSKEEYRVLRELPGSDFCLPQAL